MRGRRAKYLRKLAVTYAGIGIQYPQARTSSRQALSGNARALYRWLKGRRSRTVIV